MPSNTIYAPVNVNSLEATKVNRSDDGFYGLATLNATTNFDLVMTDDCLVLGGELIVIDATFGDYLKFSVIDIDNVMGYGANTVLKTFINKRYAKPVEYQSIITARFPAKAFAGLYLRTSYISTATTGNQPNVIVNYDLSKVLV